MSVGAAFPPLPLIIKQLWSEHMTVGSAMPPMESIIEQMEHKKAPCGTLSQFQDMMAHIEGELQINASFIVGQRCNFDCPDCFVAMRQEILERPVLQPEHYVELFRVLYDNFCCRMALIEGFEPLAGGHARKSTYALMDVTKELDCWLTLVTNASYIDEAFIEHLIDHPRCLVFPSVWGVGERNTARRKITSKKVQEKVERGFKLLAENRAAKIKTIPTTVLFPDDPVDRSGDLYQIFQWLYDMGFRHVMVDSHRVLEEDGSIKPHPAFGKRLEAIRLGRGVSNLKIDAMLAGFHLFLEPELLPGEMQSHGSHGKEFASHALADPNGLFRILPSGHINRVYEEIFRPLVTTTAPRIVPGENFSERAYELFAQMVDQATGAEVVAAE